MPIISNILIFLFQYLKISLAEGIEPEPLGEGSILESFLALLFFFISFYLLRYGKSYPN